VLARGGLFGTISKTIITEATHGFTESVSETLGRDASVDLLDSLGKNSLQVVTSGPLRWGDNQHMPYTVVLLTCKTKGGTFEPKKDQPIRFPLEIVSCPLCGQPHRYMRSDEVSEVILRNFE
jgi:hypothetical protein